MISACHIKNERREGEAPLWPSHVFGLEEALLHPDAKLYHTLLRDGEIAPEVVAGYIQQAIGVIGARVVLLWDAKRAKLAFYEQSRLVDVMV